MSRRIAILAAMPSEVKPLVKGWSQQEAPRYVSLWTHRDQDGDEWVAACAGMGATAVRRAFAAAEMRGPFDLVLSVGLAGSTGKGTQPGEVHWPREIVDVQTGERFTLPDGEPDALLATAVHTANTTEKARLRASYGAMLVDMEAATVARMAGMRGVPMRCVKAVSDTADAKLPEIDRFVDGEGQLSIARFLAHLAVRPSSWAAVAQLARNSSHASAALAEALRTFLAHKEREQTKHTGDVPLPR